MRLADIWREKITCIIHTSTQEEADMLFKAVDSYDHNGTTWVSWWNVYKKKTCYRTNLGEVVAYGCVDNYIEDGEEVIEFSDLVASGGYCNGFRGGKIPTPSEPVPIEEQFGLPKIEFKNGSYIKAIPNDNIVRGKTIKDTMDSLIDAWSKIGCTSFWMSADEVDKAIKRLEEKNLKFTFYVTEGTRVDKSCNGTIPTMTTMVSYIDKYGCIMKGTATCDKADYDERQGVLEAFANATCGNDFYKVYAEAIKEKKHRDIADRTCTYCGKVCDTIEDKNEHEAWHVERRKARHERYLLRKRAKEIAFEEAAQKMAKEIIAEDKKK